MLASLIRVCVVAVSHSTGGVLEEMNEQEIGDVIKAKEKELQVICSLQLRGSS